MDEKHTTNVVPIEEIPEDVARNFTHNDQRDMKRMGKKQELLRSFKLVTCTSNHELNTRSTRFLELANDARGQDSLLYVISC